MPIRKFCDLCDRQIKEEEPTYSINTRITSHTDPEIYQTTNWTGGRLKIDKDWEDADQAISLVCSNCLTTVLGVILGLKASRPEEKP